MGQNKALLPVGERTLLHHLAGRLASTVDEVLVAGGLYAPVAGPWRWIADARSGVGPLGGMLSGLRAAHGDVAMVAGCDQPDLEPALATMLFEHTRGVDAVVPVLATGPEGTCAVYRTRVAPVIQQQLEGADWSIRGLLGRLRVGWIVESELRAVDPDLRSFRNLNTYADYEAWLRLSKR
jgi:molybdopterin-guanine dinucleotide biosynthesis protein A